MWHRHAGRPVPGDPAPQEARTASQEARTAAQGPRTAPRGTEHDAPWLGPVMHTAFFLLLAASLARFLLRHPGAPRTPWIVALSLCLGLLYVLGQAPGARANPRRLVWLALVVAVWVVLVLLAPSYAWCAVPLFYTGLRTLPPRPALALVVVLTVFVVTAQVQLSKGGLDPNLLVAPPAVAAVATAVFVQMQRQAARQRALIDDLIRTRRDLAATERREGTLAERQRLAMEIHDTLAQGLSSQQMLLQAADRVWEGDPSMARSHVRAAGAIAERDLAEARRFVHDLAPADLAEGGGLAAALSTLAARESGPDLDVRFHEEPAPEDAPPLPDPVQSALLRIAQGALANVREHAGASRAALTLTCLEDQVVLDIADDGCGFDPAAVRQAAVGRAAVGRGAGRETASDPSRGHGLSAARARAQQLGGTLTVESAPGEGTVLSAAIPLDTPVEARS